MRPLVILCFALGGCSYFNPPCTKLAKVVCDLPGEGDTCAFVLAQNRSDPDAQALCEEVHPPAKLYSIDRADEDARELWANARARLMEAGMQADPRAGQISEKLKRSGGTAGRAVKSLEDSMQLEQQQFEERFKALE